MKTFASPRPAPGRRPRRPPLTQGLAAQRAARHRRAEIRQILDGSRVQAAEREEPSTTLVQRQPEEGPAIGSPKDPKQPPFGFTFDVLDPLNSRLRLFGYGTPSPRDVLKGVEQLRQLGRPPELTVPPYLGPLPKLSDEDLRRIGCEILPALCRPPELPPTPSLPPLTPPILRPPRLVHHAHRVLDHFVYAKDGVPDRHRGLLDRTATEMMDGPALVTDILGHTDTHGGTAYNQRLSEQRARSVEAYLRNRRVSARQIWGVSGLGETAPREPDKNNWLAAARNRRVELAMRRLLWKVTLPAGLTLQPPGGRSVTDPRPRVEAADLRSYRRLVRFMVDARTGIRGLVANPPASLSWEIRDNENVRDLMSLLDDLIADLQAQRYVVRFDQPAGDKLATYWYLQDEIHLRPFSNDQELAAVASSLVHEYAHAVQDRIAEELLRARRHPVEHTREDELRKEIEARRHGVYFALLMQALRRGNITNLSTYILHFNFETERTGSPAKQRQARTRIRKTILSHYTKQLAENAPAGRYLIEVRGDNGFLIRTGGAETALGAIPTNITKQPALENHLAGRIRRLPDYASLFRGPGGLSYGHIALVVYEGTRKLGEFGLKP